MKKRIFGRSCVLTLCCVFNIGVWAQETIRFLPHFTFKDGVWTTTLTLNNPTFFDQSVAIKAYSNDGVLSGETLLTLPPFGSINEAVNRLLTEMNAEVGWLELVTSSPSIRGMMKFAAIQGGASSLQVTDQAGRHMLFPLMENDQNWASGFAIVNIGADPIQVTLQHYALDGRLLGEAESHVSGHEKVIGMLSDFFPENLPEQSMLRITATGEITGFALSFATGLTQIVAVPSEILPEPYPEHTVTLADIEGVWTSWERGMVLEVGEVTSSTYLFTPCNCLLEKDTVPNEIGSMFIEFRQIEEEWIVMEPIDSLSQYIFKRSEALPELCQNPGSQTTSDPVVNFDCLWQQFSDHYPYFEFKGIDWDQQYETFRPQVDHDTTDSQLWELFKEMLEPLKDSHVFLTSVDQGYWYASLADFEQLIIPEFEAQNEVDDLPTYYVQQQALYFDIIRNTYLAGQVTDAGDSKIFWGSISEDIGYMNILGFDDFIPEDEQDEYPTAQIDAVDLILDLVFADFIDKQAVIVDVRFNPGGHDNLAILVTNRFTDRKRLAFSVKLKTLDGYTPFHSTWIEPTDRPSFSGPVALLTSQYSGSAAAIFAIDMVHLPQVTRIGETAGTNTTSKLDRQLPNGWLYATPNEVWIAPDGTDYYGVGVSPHLFVDHFTLADRQANRDSVIDTAVNHLLSQLSP